jgi:hypothetical protein
MDRRRSPPIGFRVDPQTKHLQLVTHETPTIDALFDLYTVRRQGSRGVAAELNHRGLLRRGGKPWSYKTVIDALVNPAYIGTVAFRDILAEDAHPAIIDRETFALAQEILTERGEHPAKSAGAATDYHLTGKIRCPRCGRPTSAPPPPANLSATATTPASPATGTAPHTVTPHGFRPTLSIRPFWTPSERSTGTAPT